MVAQLCAVAVLTSTAALAGPFAFDERRGHCVDAEGTEGWNLGVRGPCGDLRGMTLSGESFDGLDLRGAQLDGAELSGASFFITDLRGASLRHATLTGAVLTGAKLQGSRLEGATLIRAHLEHASLEGADLRGADLRLACIAHTVLAHADLRGARFSKATAVVEGARWALALVDGSTVLPFNAEELASRQLTVLETAIAVQ